MQSILYVFIIRPLKIGIKKIFFNFALRKRWILPNAGIFIWNWRLGKIGF